MDENGGMGLLQNVRQLWWSRNLPRGHASLLLADMLGRKRGSRDREWALRQTLDWLCLAQDESGCGGVCAYYDVLNGWSGPYPETTGYIAQTFIDATEQLERPDVSERAERMLDWLVGLQMPSGAFPAGVLREGRRLRATGGLSASADTGGQAASGTRGSTRPATFNTGQVMLGLLSGYHAFGRTAYAESARRAAEWLCAIQDEDGAWRTSALGGIGHTYYVSATWPLVAWGIELGERRFVEAGRRQLDWVLAQGTADGWFDHMAMDSGRVAQTHPIAYTLRGLWECGLLLEDERYLQAVEPGSRKLLEQAAAGRLAGAYGPGWTPCGRHLCLTGHAQMACLWLRMAAETNQAGLRSTASLVIDQVCDHLEPDSSCPALRGGVRGSFPITGPYMPMQMINWGAKYLVDALLLEGIGAGLREAGAPGSQSPALTGCR